jgi:GTP-binding protein EngB required for normal cell division
MLGCRIRTSGGSPVILETVPRAGGSEIRTGAKPPQAGAKFLPSSIGAIEAIAKREGADLICRRLFDLRQRVEEDRFQLAIVGQFKRGKTSVLNALLRDDVLPAGALPFTSVLTIVKYGDRQSAEVVFQSGQRLLISITDLLEYVTETGNPGNIKNVEQVEVSYPSERLRGGIRLINCPGFGSPSGRNTQTAYDFLPRMDAAIFVTSPDPPLTMAETEFLKRLSGRTKKIFLVVNKIDLCDARSLAAVLEFTQNAVSSALGDRIVVYPISARNARTQFSRQGSTGVGARGFHDLESDLQHLLHEERSDIFRASINRNLLSSVGDLQVHLKARIESAAASLSDLERKHGRLEEEINTALQSQQRNEVSLAATASLLAGLVETETSRFVESKIPHLDSMIRSHVRNCSPMSKSDLAASLDRFMCFQIQHFFEQWRPEFEISLDHALRDASAKFLKATNDAADSIRETAFLMFGAELDSHRIIEKLPVIRSTDGRRPVTQPEQERLTFLLRGPIFRWRVLHSATKAAPSELERAGWLFARDLRSRLIETTRAFMDRLQKRLNKIVEACRLAATEALVKDSEVLDTDPTLRLAADIAELDRIAELLRADLGAN